MDVPAGNDADQPREGPSLGRRVEDAYLYAEDVVVSARHPHILGLVDRVAGDSESDDEHDEYEYEDEPALEDGHARVCWLDGRDPAIEEFNNLRVVDRCLVHGDTVGFSTDPLGQKGTVVSLQILADLELPDGTRLEGVDSRALRHVRTFHPGAYVVKDLWVGRLKDVSESVEVAFEDGACCVLKNARLETLFPVHLASIDDEEDCLYYPGQLVRAASARVLKGARWLRGGWRPRRLEGTVVAVRPVCATVEWVMPAQHQGGQEDGQPPAPPPQHAPVEQLTPLSYFSPFNWQLGNRCVGPLEPARPPYSAPPPPSPSPPPAGRPPAASAALEGSRRGGGRAKPPHKRGAARRRMAGAAAVAEAGAPCSLLVVGTETTVDVLWQDGSIGRSIESCALVPVDFFDDLELLPEDYVERRAEPEGVLAGGAAPARWTGFVKSVDVGQRTALVRWVEEVDTDEHVRRADSEEVVSLYELMDRPDLNYSLGDVVVSVGVRDGAGLRPWRHGPELPSPDPLRAGSSHAPPPAASAQDSVPSEGAVASAAAEEEAGGSEMALADAPEEGVSPPDLTWVGEVIGFTQGRVLVAWADGVVSEVDPATVSVVNREEEEADAEDEGVEGTAPGLETAEDETASWETASAASDPEDDKDMADSPQPHATPGENDDEFPSGTGPMETGLPTAQTLEPPSHRPSASHASEVALERPLSVGLKDMSGAALAVGHASPGEAGGAVGRVRDVEHAERDGSIGVSFPSGDFGASGTEVAEEELAKGAASGPVPKQGQVGSSGGTTDAPAGPGPLAGIKSFEFVADASDHHFVGQAAGASVSLQRNFMKRVHKEYGILQNDLPDSIFVRVYEERIDLVRAVIVGASGTVYEGGLFVFDLWLPPDYPSVPPEAYYHSWGLRLNPNLYENGRVCLSLLNTWQGRDTEKWQPDTSTILQVLVSIQGLVLVSNPFYNEAGYERLVGTKEGEKGSLAYNESALLLSLKSMLYLLRRPPLHTESLVRAHFRSYGPRALEYCKALIGVEGQPTPGVAQQPHESSAETSADAATASCMPRKASEGFKLVLSKLLPRLELAFANAIGGE